MRRIDEETGVSVEKTGYMYSFNGKEYLALFPDGTTMTIGSPPWNEFDEEEEDEGALEYAVSVWKEILRDPSSRPLLEEGHRYGKYEGEHPISGTIVEVRDEDCAVKWWRPYDWKGSPQAGEETLENIPQSMLKEKKSGDR